MGGFRKTDPALVAEDHAEVRTVPKLPGKSMSVDVELAPTDVFFDAIFGDAEMEGKLATAAQFQGIGWIALDKGLGLTLMREPRGPDLDRESGRFCSTAFSAQIHQQIAEPPSAASVSQAAAQEPHLITAFHLAGGVHGVHVARVQ